MLINSSVSMKFKSIVIVRAKIFRIISIFAPVADYLYAYKLI